MDNAAEWTSEGPNIISPQQLEAIRQAFADSSLIVEHRFYHGSRAPSLTVFDEFADFEQYLRENARPGDSVWCWRYNDVCRDDNCLTHGKYPDDNGRTPRGGAY